MRIKYKDMKDKILLKDQELTSIKKSVKFTRIQEIQVIKLNELSLRLKLSSINRKLSDLEAFWKNLKDYM